MEHTKEQMAAKAALDKVSKTLKLLRWMFSLLLALILGVPWSQLSAS